MLISVLYSAAPRYANSATKSGLLTHFFPNEIIHFGANRHLEIQYGCHLIDLSTKLEWPFVLCCFRKCGDLQTIS